MMLFLWIDRTYFWLIQIADYMRRPLSIELARLLIHDSAMMIDLDGLTLWCW